MIEAGPIRIVALNGSPHRKGQPVVLMGRVLERCDEVGSKVECSHSVD